MFMCSSESGSAFSTLQVLAALPSHSVFSSLSLVCFVYSRVSCFLPSYRGLTLVSPLDSVLHLSRITARVPGLSLCLAHLDIVCRSPTHACSKDYSCVLPVPYLFANVLTLLVCDYVF